MLGQRTLNRQECGLIALVLQRAVEKLGMCREVGPHLGAIRGVDDQHQPIGESIHEAIVFDRPPVVQYRRVLDLADSKRRRIIRRDGVDKVERLGAANDEFAHVADVEHAASLTHGNVFSSDAARVVDRHEMTAERDHLGTELRMDRRKRRTAQDRLFNCGRRRHRRKKYARRPFGLPGASPPPLTSALAQREKYAPGCHAILAHE